MMDRIREFGHKHYNIQVEKKLSSEAIEIKRIVEEQFLIFWELKIEGNYFIAEWILIIEFTSIYRKDHNLVKHGWNELNFRPYHKSMKLGPK